MKGKTMKTVSKTIDVYLDKGGNYDEVSIMLGNVPIVIQADGRYLTECLQNGYCDIDMPSNAFDVMWKHRVFRFKNGTNPEIMKMLRDVFVHRNEKRFKDTGVQSRKVLHLTLRKDKTIPGLLDDEALGNLRAQSN
jgi:hypothetical protein